MNHDLDLVLSDCLSRLQAGASVDDCLADYPALAAALRPDLELAAAIQVLPAPQPRPDAVQANRERMMAAVARRQQTAPVAAVLPIPVSEPLLSRYTRRISALFKGQKEGKGMVFAMKFATAAIVAMMSLGAMSMGAAAVASTNSLPGDALYPVKRAIEDVQLTLTPGEGARQQFQIELEVRRRYEVQAVLQQQRRVEVQFWGTIESFDAAQWVVDGFTVLVDGQTRIVGEPEIGLKVHVLGITQEDGSIQASQLTVKNGSPAQQGPGWATPGPHGTGTPQGTQTKKQQGPQATPGPQGTQTQKQQGPQGTPGPQGTQTQQRDQDRECTSTPIQQRDRDRDGTPQATPNPQGTQAQPGAGQQNQGTPQSGGSGGGGH
ncbi:MAG: hypothetical protein KKA73_01145 [Chloroflexi bacterium]|nr:hypothetical protein [Chloroflexota bacterium]MBU1746270.1 hypothetical protein [Chloroflexota bacterium]